MTLEIDGIVATSQQHLEKLGASKEDGAFLHRDGRSRWRVEAAWESGGGSIGRSAPNWWARPTWRAMGARRVRGTCLLVVEAAVCSPGRVISRFQEYFFFRTCWVRRNCDSNMFSMVSLSKSERREESRKPLANGLLSIFSLVICIRCWHWFYQFRIQFPLKLKFVKHFTRPDF